MNISTFKIDSLNENNYLLSTLIEKKPSNENIFQNKTLSVTHTSRQTKIKGKIFFYDCSNGTSCLYVGNFQKANCVSTENALIIGIGGFYQEFVNNSNQSNLESFSKRKLNLKKISQFCYSPRISGAFVSEENYSQGVKKSSKTLYHNGTLLQHFYSRDCVPLKLASHLPERSLDSLENRTKSSETFASDLDDKQEEFALVSYPFEKQLISIIGTFKGDEKSFVVKGKAPVSYTHLTLPTILLV